MNDRKPLFHPFAVLALMVPAAFGVALIDFRDERQLEVAQVPAPARMLPTASQATPAQPPPRPRAPLPVLGEVEHVPLESGAVLHMQRLPDDYVHEGENPGDRSLDAFAMQEPPELPPNRMPVDPKALGFDSMWDLEQNLRARYGIAADKPVEIWMEQRGDKLGVAIDVNNPEPEPTHDDP